MEKLVELHKEFVKLKRDYELIYYNIEYKCFCFDCCDSFYDFSEWAIQLLISKDYDFIKRLVDNDKIDTESWPLYWFHFIMSNRQPYSFYETLLMLLSISDTPIEDLISYLK